MNVVSNRVLMANPGLEAGLGTVQWELVACLGLAWLMVYLIVWKGLHQSGKVMLHCFMAHHHLNMQS